MRLNAEQLQRSFSKRIAPVYLVSGDEPLLVGEAAAAIRAAARAAGYADRRVFFIDKSFDWDEVRQETRSLSLFADRRLFELRMPSGKPDKGAEVLVDFASHPPPDMMCLVIAEKLDAKSSQTPWVRAFEEHGAWVRVWPVDTAELPQWLRGRAAALNAELDSEAAQLIVERVEGNLLAANQELEKLVLLANGARIDAALVLRAVGNSARYDVFQLGVAAAAGDAERALRILLGLKSEGIEPPLILWALIRELRGLWQAQESSRLRSSGRAGWNLAATPSAQALARLGALPLARLMRQAHYTDRVVKGLAGGDAWTAITGLVAALAGALQASVDSGRVAI